MTDEQLDRAVEVLDAVRRRARQAGEASRWGPLNWHFHAALYAPAKRNFTMGVLQKLHQHSDRYFRMQVLLRTAADAANAGAPRDRRGGAQGRCQGGDAADAGAHPRRRPVASRIAPRAAQRLGHDCVAAGRRQRRPVTAPAKLRHFIDGDWRASDSDRWIADVNPSNAEDVVAQVPAGTSDDVDLAVRSAASSLAAWRALTGPARAELLYKWADAIGSRADELAQLVTREVGKPIGEARGEVGRCVMILRYYAGEAVRAIGEVIPAQAAGCAAVHAAPAARRRRAHHAVEFPGRDSAVEGGAGAGVRQHRRAQAGRDRRRSRRSFLAECAAAAGLAARACSTSCSARATSSARRSIDADDVRAVSFTGSGTNRRDGRRGRGSAEHSISDGNGRQERRDRDARRRSRSGGVAHRRRRDALRRSEVHGDESRRRRARGRRRVPRPSCARRSPRFRLVR